MSTTSTPRRVKPACRLLTAADLAALPSELPSGPVRYELDNGELIVMAPPGDIHSAAQSNLVTELKNQGERRGLGKARSEVGIILWRDPDRVVGAEVAFIANDSLPLRKSPEGYLETIPGLVAEVVSKNDTESEVQDKVKAYLKAGVRVVWVVDPSSKSVVVLRKSRKPKTFDENETLTIEDVIPGFQVMVGAIFQE